MELPKKQLCPLLFFINPKTGEPSFFRRGKNPPVERLLAYAPKEIDVFYFFKFGCVKSVHVRRGSSFSSVNKNSAQIPEWIWVIEELIESKWGRMQIKLKRESLEKLKMASKKKAKKHRISA